MKAYQITSGGQIGGLTLAERGAGILGPWDVRLGVKAVSLNFRDLMIARGHYPAPVANPVIPVSDGAAEVLEIGPAVTRVKPGDRVVAAFFPGWAEGDATPGKVADSLGGSVDGMLAEEVVLHEQSLAVIPAHMDFVEAATLPCAAVTAWNALFVSGNARPGQTVLLLGTGGVSIWALQLAKAAGLRAIVTSSSNPKLDRARSLGAHATINYNETPQWQAEVRKLTAGLGVDIVVEVGGQATMERSFASTRMGGTVATVGMLGGIEGNFPPSLLFRGVGTKCVAVGSRAMLEDACRLASVADIHPVVDRVFSFGQAREAYEYLASGRHFGKVVIQVAA